MESHKTSNRSPIFLQNNYPNHPQLIFNGSVVKMVNEQKYLGLILDTSLSFKKHLNEKIVKGKKYIGIIKHLSKYLPLINPPPQLSTFDPLMGKSERVQYQAALAVTGACHGS